MQDKSGATENQCRKINAKIVKISKNIAIPILDMDMDIGYYFDWNNHM